MKANFSITNAIGLKVYVILTFALALYVCLWNLGSHSIGPGDENLYVRVTQSVLQGKAFFIPTTEGRVFVEKPPLKYWLSAIPPYFLGESNFSHRMMDALFGVLTILISALLCHNRTKNGFLFFLTALLLISSERFLFNHGARHAVHDSMLVAFVTLSMWACWHYHCATSTIQAKRYLGLCAIFTICSVMSKSVAGLLPIPIVVCFIAFARTSRTTKLPLGELATYIIASIGVPAIYFVAAYVIHSPGEWRYAFGHQVYSRFKDGYHNANDTFFYFERLFVDGVAITPVLAVIGILYVAYESLVNKDTFCTLLSCWILIPLAGYSVLTSRLTWYISPMFPALAIAGTLAVAWIYRIGTGDWLRKATGTTVLIGIFLLVGSDLQQNVRKLYDTKARYPFDLATHGILRHLENNKFPTTPQPVYWLKRKKIGFALHEKPYRMMLSPYLLTTNNYQKVKQGIKSGTVAFAILTSNDLFTLLKESSPTGFRLLPPLFDRGKWFGILSYTKEVPEDFHPVTQRHVISEPSNRPIKLKGNRLLAKFGAHISVTTSSGLDGLKELTVNGKTYYPTVLQEHQDALHFFIPESEELRTILEISWPSDVPSFDLQVAIDRP